MKVVVSYTIRKAVEIEIDDRFEALLDPDNSYMTDITMAKELKDNVIRKINDTGIVEVTEVCTAEDKEILWEW